MKKFAVVFFSLFCIHIYGAIIENTRTATIDKATSYISYHLSNPLHSWDGVCKAVEGAIEYDAKNFQITKVTITAKVASFDSKNKLRDERMLKITNAQVYPEVKFISTSVKENINAVIVNGIITFHGISKPISFTASEAFLNKRKIITSKFVLLLTDFNVERPSLLLMKTDNEMNMSFSVEIPMQ